MNVPEIWFKAKRVIRTVVQTVLSAAVTIALGVIVAAQVAPDVLDAITAVLPPSWAAWLAGAVGFLVALAGALARVMAIPTINAFLVRIGLGSVPASAVTGTGSEIDATAIRDPERAAAELLSVANRRTP